MDIRPVKTAIIGCGMISNIYIRNLKNLFSIVDLVVLCDMRKESAEEKAKLYGIQRVMTLDEIESDPDIEMVIILTGPSVHYDIIKRMLLAGKHVYSEKTLTVTVEESRELCAIADEKGLYLGASPDTVLGAGIQTAKKLIEAGLIGKVTSCYASINRNQPLNSEVFRFIQNGSGGCFPMDVGVYYVAALLALLGPVKEVKGFTMEAPIHEKEMLYLNNKDSWKLEGANLAVGALNFKNGVLGTLHFNGLSLNIEQPEIRIFGTNGILKLGDPNTFNGNVRFLNPLGEEVDMPFTHGYDGVPTLEDATSYETMYGHRGVGAAEMAWAIRENRKNRCSKEFATHTLEVLSGMEESSKSGATYKTKTNFEFKALKSGYYSTTFGRGMRADAERSLID